MSTERDFNVLLLGLQAILQAERLSDLGATTVWDARENSDGTWAVGVRDSKGGYVDLFQVADSDPVCLEAGLVAEDFTKRMVQRINAAMDLARASEASTP